jgi:anti-sigma regulatory factor (Ser/Thr protein kinase)
MARPVNPSSRPAIFAASRYPHQDVLSDELELAALPSAVSLTRCFIEEYLRKWSLEDLADVAQLVASEIVTNAIKVTGLTEQPADCTALHDADIGRVITRMRWSASRLIIETWDGDHHTPVAASPLDLDEGGRGLMIVAALTAAWGHYPAATGKVVWAQLTIPGARTPAGPGRPARTRQ